LALLAAFLFGLVIEQRVVLAQSDAPQTRDVTADEVNTVARELWCPLCSGVRLDSCELKACDQMKDEIAIKLAEGQDADTIKAYFLEQYGPQVLGEPPRQGFNWLAWILPVVALVAGGFIFWRMTNQLMRPSAAQAATSSAAMPPKPGIAGDDYDQKLDEELAKHG
jgi:cytochrome c-type biogenesis protein CcmH